MGLCFLIAQFLQPVVETIFRDHLSSKFWPALPIHLPFGSFPIRFPEKLAVNLLGFGILSHKTAEIIVGVDHL